jgi:hypothetical protein
VTTAITDTPASTEADSADALEVVLAFKSLDDYRAMGDDLATVRTSLDLPAWSTATEVIMAAMKELAT